ncbi:phosphodiester glycosidase family protein [Leeia sp.]|uniref:phosphodiester glycosidase family protein n=1 Tax=Leeia sp. TaxID=2884678 RepID=UPI0035B3AC11
MQPNGVFLVHAGRAEIVSTRAWLKRTDMQRAAVQYATQSGPLLLVDGKINPQFDPASRNKTVRNAVCVQDAQTVSLVTTGTPVSFYQFASLLQQRLGCQSALYLDGAISTFYPAPFLTPQVQLGPMLGVVAPVSPP